uniref:Transmembrane protein n=1 Tax=Elaeophora elaphi TaxID=1147741 RepID=A0A0R3S287_9BILA
MKLKFQNQYFSDAWIILFGHIVLTLIQVLVILGFLGHLSVRLGLQPIELLDRGEAQMWHILAYMSYVPDIRTWTAILLFMCIFVLLNIFASFCYYFLLGCRSPDLKITYVFFQYLLILNILATFEDAFGEKSSRCFPRFVLNLLICSVAFVFSLYFATQGGRYAHELVGGYLRYVTLWIILFFEMLAVGWFYCRYYSTLMKATLLSAPKEGAHRLGKDLHTMLRRACCWCVGHFILYFVYLLPAIPVATATLNLINYDYSTYSSGVHEWKYSEVLGWTIALIPLLPIPLFMQFRICRTCIKGPGVTKWQKLKNAISSPLPYEVIKMSSPPAIRGYSSDTPGYVLLPQAPLAEPEVFSEVRFEHY